MASDILQISFDVNDSTCAFVTQLHVIALVDTVFDYIRRQRLSHRQPESPTTPPYHLCIVQPLHRLCPEFRCPQPPPVLDISFFPGVHVEARINFPQMRTAERKLLEVFTDKMLFDPSQKSIEFGRQAGPSSSLRPLLSEVRSPMLLIFFLCRLDDVSDVLVEEQELAQHIVRCQINEQWLSLFGLSLFLSWDIWCSETN
jgi:hypothetical protein